VFPSLGVAIGAVGIVLSGTRGSAFVAVLIVVTLFIIRSRTFFWRSITLVGALAVLSCVFLYAGDINEMMGRSSQTLEGWDGRTEIWTTYLTDFFRTGSIVFGLGMQTGGRFLASAHGDTLFGNMHNMYLEALVDIGVFGLSILVACLIVLLPSIRVINRLQNRQHVSELCFCWLIFLSGLVSGLESQGLFGEDIPAISVVVPYLIIMTMRVRRADAL
jgi:O-antigen ligase